MRLEDAIARYHELCIGDLAADSWDQLRREQRARNLYFGDRPLTIVLRPRFLTLEQYRTIRHEVEILLSAFDKAYRRLLADPAFRQQLDLTEAEEYVISIDRQYHTPTPNARLDGFFCPDDNTFRSVEYNAESPAAVAYGDALTELFMDLPLMRAFRQDYTVLSLPGRHQMLQVLLDCYREAGFRDRPRIAIVDWHGVPTASEFDLFRDYFTAQGYQCIICDPNEMEYRDGVLRHGDFTINIIYKRVLISELLDKFGTEHPIIHAVRDGAAIMVNPFRCKLLHKKLIFAVLSDEANQNLFSAEEQRAIAEHIPWTRKVAERHTTYNGGRIDLVPFILDNQDRLVLKPNDEYGGKGVVIGWETPADEWARAVEMALGESYLVQERVRLPYEDYPAFVNDEVEFAPRLLDTDPYIWHGHFVQSCLTRLSQVTLLNVTAGGGSTVPTLLVTERAG